MSSDERPVVVAFDGSDAAGEAVRQAAALFGGRRLIVLSVWEPNLALAMGPTTDLAGMAYMPPRPEDVATLDRAQRDRATATAESGAEIARELGVTAEAVAVSDELDISETIVGIAQQHDACAIVVGSRGRGAVKSLFGSTSRGLLNHADRPVVVVKSAD
jgi:nucleotide-binding universal stress UspA family protein